MSAENSTSNKKFEEALHLLNEAAREKKDEIQDLISGKYEHIREAVLDAAGEGRKRFKRTRRAAEDTIEEGGEKLKEAVSDFEDKVRENPWAYVGGVALVSLLLGFILAGSKEK